jgi:hypothetical protein
MKWLEIIQLRSYSKPDRDDALAAFQQLSLPAQESGLEDIILFRRIALENDLCIFIHWEGEVPGTGKSPLGLQLAAAFLEFGQINHSAWAHEGSVPDEGKEDNPS